MKFKFNSGHRAAEIPGGWVLRTVFSVDDESAATAKAKGVLQKYHLSDASAFKLTKQKMR